MNVKFCKFVFIYKIYKKLIYNNYKICYNLLVKIYMEIRRIMANIIMGFRESFEAILLISVIVVFLTKNDLINLKKYAYYGFGAGIIVSLTIAFALGYLDKMMMSQGEVFEMIWELGSALVACVLLFIMVVSMIKNKGSMGKDVEERTSRNIGKSSIFFVSLLMVAREGFELILFILANPDKSNIALEVIIGITLACLLGIGLNKSIIKVNLKTVFTILLIYLILQVGALFGDAMGGIIELLQYLNIGSGLSKGPQIIQFIGQYTIIGYLFWLYYKYSIKN